MPAQAGIQKLRRNSLDSRFRGNDAGGLARTVYPEGNFALPVRTTIVKTRKMVAINPHTDESNPARLSKALLV